MLCFFLMNLLFVRLHAKNPILELFIKHHPRAKNQELGPWSYSCTPGSASPECSYHGTCTTSGNECICDKGYALELVYSDSSLNLLAKCNENLDTIEWNIFLLVIFVILCTICCPGLAFI